MEYLLTNWVTYIALCVIIFPIYILVMAIRDAVATRKFQRDQAAKARRPHDRDGS